MAKKSINIIRTKPTTVPRNTFPPSEARKRRKALGEAQQLRSLCREGGADRGERPDQDKKRRDREKCSGYVFPAANGSRI